MEMAENTKIDSISPRFDEEKNRVSVSVSDHVNGFTYKKSDNFVIDMDSVSGPGKEVNQNSRITLQRSLSRKGSQRNGGAATVAAEKKMNSNNTERDNNIISSSTSSPRGHVSPEKQTTVGTVEHSGLLSPVNHHQITITTGEGRCMMKRNSFKRSPSSWVFDPKRVLLFFATLSSMGTILLIYFTLSIRKYAADEASLD